MVKKIKGIKKVKRFGIGKFLVMALVLGGGLIYGVQMVQKNQENRSSAAGTKILPCRCSKSVYKTAYLCAKAKGSWICPEMTKTPVNRCSNSSCGSCFKPTECSNAGCRWDSKANSCIKKSGDGSKPGEKVICTSVMYSTWSPCKDGKRTRTIFEKNPSGCTVENPILSESCVVCDSITYTSWSSCVNGFQTRSVSEKSPSGCILDNPVIVQTCTKVAPTREMTRTY